MASIDLASVPDSIEHTVEFAAASAELEPPNPAGFARTDGEIRYVRLLVLFDFLVGTAAAGAALMLRFGAAAGETYNRNYLFVTAFLPFVWLASLGINRAFETRYLFVGNSEYERVFRAGIGLTAALAVVSFSLNLELARGYVLIAMPLATVAGLCVRYLMRHRLHRAWARGHRLRRVLLVGHPPAVRETASQLSRERYHGMGVVGVCLPAPAHRPTTPAGAHGGLDPHLVPAPHLPTQSHQQTHLAQSSLSAAQPPPASQTHPGPLNYPGTQSHPAPSSHPGTQSHLAAHLAPARHQATRARLMAPRHPATVLAPGHERYQLPPVFGTFDEVALAVRRARADTVIVLSCPELDGSALRRLAWKLERDDIDLIVASTLIDVAGDRTTIRPVDGLPLMHVEHPRLKGGQRVLKEIFDRVLALLGLVALSPLLVLLAALVRLTGGPGSVIFRQVRVGRFGRQFVMYKFRSMYADAEARLAALRHLNDNDGTLFKMRDDPRVTPVGRWLRRLSLDEIPQLLNVLKGDMSLVGPRPPLPSEVAEYPFDMRRRLAVKPGLTGLWQVSGRSDLSWEESIRLDVRYVENWSFTWDLMILARTVLAIWRGSGAY